MPKKRKPSWHRAPFDAWARATVLDLRRNRLDDLAAEVESLAGAAAVQRLVGQLLGKCGPRVIDPNTDGQLKPLLLPGVLLMLLKHPESRSIWADLRPRFKAELEQRAPFDSLSPGRRRRICAVGTLVSTAAFAANSNTRLRRGGPLDLGDPGDVVGTLRSKSGGQDSRRDCAKAVAGKVMGVALDLYGIPLCKPVRLLTKLATGVNLSPAEIDALLERHRAVKPELTPTGAAQASSP
jgi:hypothetical protein